jgi:3-hydroxybutyryl-CoA dehydrogenase
MPVRTIGVIGAGTMGAGIAQIAITAGLEMILIDVSDAAVEKGLDIIKGNLERMVAKGKLTESDKDTALTSIRGATTF